jgi:hypothetical protein
MRVAVTAVLMLVLALPAPAAPGSGRASLELESSVPLIIGGTGFGAREPVLLTYTASDLTRRVVGVKAKRNGSFRARFKLRPDRCAAFTVHAAGVRGSRAVLQVDPVCEGGKKPKGPPKRAPRIPEPPDD